MNQTRATNNNDNNVKSMTIRQLSGVLLGALLLFVGCKAERTEYEGPDYITFSAESYDLGVLDAEEWFDIPVSATRKAECERTIGVEILDRESNAIEGLHYTLESSTIRIKAGELATSVRIKGNPDNIALTDSLGIRLRLVIDEDKVWDSYGTDATVNLHKCCPMDMNAFTGYCKITSTWLMQYMNSEARLVTTELDPKDETTVIVKDMFYDGYDVRVKFYGDDRLNPIVEFEPQMIGTTGEAFGTIYGNGKLMMMSPTGYSSYFGTCETFMVQYATIYVDEVGTVGTYVHIFEWISDDEAERIKREGF